MEDQTTSAVVHSATTMDRPNVDYGDGEVARANEILRCVVGSGVHGIAIEGTDDHDEMGVFVEPPDYCLGVHRSFDNHVWRTQPEGVRSGPGDIDLTIYSLRKYVRLALAGNPTILIPLYAQGADVLRVTDLGAELREMTPRIVSRHVGRRFLGYLDQQHERMLGKGKQNRVPKRPELVRVHGFDTKYASHAVRLSLQGIELMRTGRLSLPMTDADRALCLRVKRGMIGLSETLRIIKSNRATLAALVDAVDGDGDSPLPREPDYAAVNDWLISAHLRHWGVGRR